MATHPLVLASGSPRRRMLLHMAGFNIAEVSPPDIPEVRQPDEQPIAYCRRLSIEKASAVQAHNAWILAADTIVHLGEQIFEKPLSDAHAEQMLSTLSGQWHQVTSAWCLRWSGPAAAPTAPKTIFRGHQTSRVKFRPLTTEEIRRYNDTGEGRDKAGAYAIQGDGSALISRVVGSTTNVVGLPVEAVTEKLLIAGVTRGIQT